MLPITLTRRYVFWVLKGNKKKDLFFISLSSFSLSLFKRVAKRITLPGLEPGLQQ